MKKKLLISSFAVLSVLALLVPLAFAAKPIVQQVTGGGWILYGCPEESKKTFGFNAEELEDGELRGNVEYVDHGPFGIYDRGFPHVHGYDITKLAISGKQAYIEGICRLNGDNTPRAFGVLVIDENEPGKHDWFSIWVDLNGNGVADAGDYWAGAELGFPEDAGGGGNIQVHVPSP